MSSHDKYATIEKECAEFGEANGKGRNSIESNVGLASR